MLGRDELGIAREHALRFLARDEVELLVAHRIRDAERRLAALPRAEQVAHPAQSEVVPRDLEAVVGPGEDAESLRGLLPDVAQEDAVRLLRAAPDAPAELVQLRQAEALRMLD